MLRNGDRWVIGYLLALAGFGLWIRLAGLSAFAFSPDDLLHFLFADVVSQQGVWARFRDQMHPPGMFYILHGMLGISRNEIFLRSVSWIPGILTVLALFAVGRLAVGPIGGLAAAALASFGFASVIMSQVVRGYSLLAFLLVITLYLGEKIMNLDASGQHSNENRPVAFRMYLCSYSLVAMCMCAVHYSAVIALTGLGISWLLEWKRRQQPLRAYLKIAVVHMPALLLLTVLLRRHLRHIGIGHLPARQPYLLPFFPHTIGELGAHTLDLMEFFSLPKLAWPVLILTIIGTALLFVRGRRWLAGSILATTVLSWVLALVEIYPFGAVRQSFLLMPFVALGVGAAIEALLSRIQPVRWICRIVVASLLIILMLGYRPSHYLRKSHCAQDVVRMEFPVSRADVDALQTILAKGAKPGDIIFGCMQPSLYLSWSAGPGSLHRISKDSQWMMWGPIHCYFSRRFAITDERQLLDCLKDIRPHLPSTFGGRIWFVNIGWWSIASVIPPTSRLKATVLEEHHGDAMQILVLSPSILSFLPRN